MQQPPVAGNATCLTCGKPFVPQISREGRPYRYCSPECANEARERSARSESHARPVTGGQSSVPPSPTAGSRAAPTPLARNVAGPPPPSNVPPTGHPALPPGYLEGGYFDPEQHLRPELVDRTAHEVAQAFGRAGMTNGQVRRFFNKVRMIEGKLASGAAFAEIRAEIASLRPNVASATARNVAPPIFKDFIDANVPLALETERAFLTGFVRHFTAVAEWFTYVNRRG